MVKVELLLDREEYDALKFVVENQAINATAASTGLNAMALVGDQLVLAAQIRNDAINFNSLHKKLLTCREEIVH